MDHLKIKRKLDRTIIQRKIEKNEQISGVEMDILCKQEISALLPVQLISGFAGNRLMFTVSGMVTLSEYLKSGIPFSSFLSVVEQVADTMQACEAHGVRSSNLELDSELIFFDYANKTVRMLYWPLLTLEEYEDRTAFFVQMGKLYRCPERDSSYKNLYLSFFESRASFELPRFRRQMETLQKHWNKQQDEAVLGQERESAAALKKAAEQQQNVRTECFDPEGTVALMTASLFRVADNSTIPLTRFPFTVGRQRELCDYVLEENAYLGRQHMTLLERNGAVYLRDNGSVNGTLLDGRPVQSNQEVLLRSGSTIRVGSEEFLFFAAGGQRG